MAYFQEGLKQEFATKDDLDRVEHKITATLDRYLKKTETWHDELSVPKALHNRLAGILTDKHIVSEGELAL